MDINICSWHRLMNEIACTADTLFWSSLVPISHFDFRACVIPWHILQRFLLAVVNVFFRFVPLQSPLHPFPRFAPVGCFPALGIGLKFSHTRHQLGVFPRLAPVEYFYAPCIGCIFSRAWHLLDVFPRLAPVGCFPALGSGCIFFPCLALVGCFPALGALNLLVTDLTFSRACDTFSRAWHRLQVFPCLDC